MILTCFYVSNIGSLSTPVYKKRTNTEMKAIKRKRRSGGKDLISRIYSINNLVMLFDIKYHKVHRITKYKGFICV